MSSMPQNISKSIHVITNQALLNFVSSTVCITLGWEVKWWRWSFSFWGWAQMGWWVRRSAARSTRRGCRSKPAAGNGWRWGWCWWSLKPGSGFDCPGLGGGRWGCERTDQQLVWQTARLPAPGMSVWCTHGCVCVCVCGWERESLCAIGWN